MKIDIKATNLDLTPALKEYIEEKVNALDKHIHVKDESETNAPVEAFVEVARVTRHHKKGDVFKAEINLKIHGELLRVDYGDQDVRAALDIAKDIMIKEIEKFKGARLSKERRGQRKFKILKSISPLAWFKKERK